VAFHRQDAPGQKGEVALSTAAKNLASNQWPASVMRYFLGSIPGDAVLAAAAREPEVIQEHLYEAYYYQGAAAIILKDATEAGKLFKAALATNMVRYKEYAAAQAELGRLEPSAGEQKPDLKQ
jgi:lipoprotein NlpI